MEQKNRELIERIIFQYAFFTFPKRVTKELQTWLQNGANSEEKDRVLWIIWNSIDPKSDKNSERVLRHIKKILGHTVETPKLTLSRISVRVAAVIIPILLIAAPFFMTRNEPESNEIRKEYAATRDAIQGKTLEDGTVIEVNKMSSVVAKHDREVAMSGEVYFKVAKDAEHPFSVVTEHLTITVLGTEFNVEAYPDSGQTKVSLYSGRVNVSVPPHNIELTAGSVLTFDNESSQFSIEEIETIKPEWASTKIEFNYERLGNIFDYIESNYGLAISCTDGRILNSITTFRLNGNENIVLVMELLCRVNGNFDYTIKGDKIVIRTNNL